MKPSKNTYLIQTGIIAFASLLTLLVQTCFWVDAGKEKVNKSSDYSYQMNSWAEAIHTKFDKIRDSGTYSRLSLYTGKKTVDYQFISDVNEYHHQIKALLRVLKFQGYVAVNIMQDTTPLIERVAYLEKYDAINKVQEDYQKFYDFSKEYQKRLDAIEMFLPELQEAFKIQDKKLSTSDKVDLTLKQIDALKRLYSNEYLFLKHGTDPFKYIRSFAMNSEKILADYEDLLPIYNDEVKKELSYKTSIIIFIALFAAFFSFRKELES